MIILPTSHPNPLFGHSVDDDTASSETWTGVKEYRNLTIPDGVIVQAGTMRYGPLVIKCSGTLLIQAGGILHADEKGEFFKHAGNWRSNGGVTGGPYGQSSASGWGKSYANIQGAPGAQALAVVGAGGGGGGSQNEPGHASWMGWGGNSDHYYSPLFTDYEVDGGAAGAVGEDGADHITGGQDPVDYIMSVLTTVGVGTGGGMGGADASPEIFIPGGASGGSLIILAREVIIEATGIIHANGADGDDAVQANDGGGGGGSGGYIGIFTERYVEIGTVEVAGGAGGAKNGGGGVGGAGSVGCIKIERAA